MVFDELIYAIIERAVLDYRYLKDKGLRSVNRRDERFNVRELECFFCSQWCNFLLEVAGCGLTGVDILNRLKRE